MIQAFRSQQLGLPRWPWRRAGEQRDTPTQLKGPPRLHLFSRHVLERPADGPPRPRSAATASTSHRHRRASSRGVSVGGVPARLAVSASAWRRASRRAAPRPPRCAVGFPPQWCLSSPTSLPRANFGGTRRQPGHVSAHHPHSPRAKIPSYRCRAEQLRALLASDNGLATAVTALETLLEPQPSAQRPKPLEPAPCRQST